MIYVVILEDTRLHRSGIEPTVTLHASSLAAAQRLNELMLAYQVEFGSRAAYPLWTVDLGDKGICYERHIGDEVFRIHVGPKELRS